MRKQAGGDVGVVLKEIALREPEARPEDLSQVGETDVSAVDAQDHVVLIARDPYGFLQSSNPAIFLFSGGSLGGRAPWRFAPATRA